MDMNDILEIEQEIRVAQSNILTVVDNDVVHVKLLDKDQLMLADCQLDRVFLNGKNGYFGSIRRWIDEKYPSWHFIELTRDSWFKTNPAGVRRELNYIRAKDGAPKLRHGLIIKCSVCVTLITIGDECSIQTISNPENFIKSLKHITDLE